MLWHWICDHHPPPHPHGSTADPHQSSCCNNKEGELSQSQEHFLHGFQEEKQSTRDVTQGSSCHKASQRSAASRVWLKQKIKLKNTFHQPSSSVWCSGHDHFCSFKYSSEKLYDWGRVSLPEVTTKCQSPELQQMMTKELVPKWLKWPIVKPAL